MRRPITRAKTADPVVWIGLVLGTIAAVEIAIRLPLGRTLASLKRVSRRSMWVVSSKRISDDWKEKALPAYAGRMFGGSLRLFGILLAIATPVVALAAVTTGSLAEGSAVLLRPLALGLMIAVGIGYVTLRRRWMAR